MPYSLGLDFGTSSVRALVAGTRDGREVGLGVAAYPSGEAGILTDPRDPLLARQHPGDYASVLEAAARSALERARDADREFSPDLVVGIGVDATASTPIPVDARCIPLALDERFSRDLDAMAWLWKDHTAHAEAAEITAAAARHHPEYLAKCGGAYSSEWYFSKLLHALRAAPRVLAAADGWVEEGDYITGLLTGASAPREMKRGACAAGHKAMYSASWGGFPSPDLLEKVDHRLGEWCRGRLPERVFPSDQPAGRLAPDWAARLGLPAGIPVAAAAIDAHVGAVGAGVRPGVLIKILGTSACDMLVHPRSAPLAEIPGICGVAADSILPGHLGLEAGQPAVGDIFGWFVREFGEPAGLTHERLTADAARLVPGETGLLALDWHNGNRSVLADPLLTGCIVGYSLATRPAEVYRSLIEATAFGARVILERFEEHGVPIREVVVCGGIAARNPFLLQIYADVLGRPIRISRSSETCALGAAIFGAVVGGAHARTEEAQRAMTGVKETLFKPEPGALAVYRELYALYRSLHDAFGLHRKPADLGGVMKTLIAVRDRARGSSEGGTGKVCT